MKPFQVLHLRPSAQSADSTTEHTEGFQPRKTKARKTRNADTRESSMKPFQVFHRRIQPRNTRKGFNHTKNTKCRYTRVFYEAAPSTPSASIGAIGEFNHGIHRRVFKPRKTRNADTRESSMKPFQVLHLRYSTTAHTEGFNHEKHEKHEMLIHANLL